MRDRDKKDFSQKLQELPIRKETPTKGKTMQNRNPNTRLGWTTAGNPYRALDDFDKTVAGIQSWITIGSTTPRWKEEEPSATIETAELFWELIRDELEAIKEWKSQAVHVQMFRNTWGFEPDNLHTYKKGAHTLDLNTPGKIKYIGYRAPWIDTTIDLTDGDTLEALMTWIHEGGKIFPLYKKEKRGGLTWVEHPPKADTPTTYLND